MNHTATKITVVAMYKFVHLPDFRKLRESLLTICKKSGIKGTILLAEEGINGTIAGFRKDIDSLIHELRKDPRFVDLEFKLSFVDSMPFYRMKVKLKKEIVTMGIPEINPVHRNGKRLGVKDWNELISDPDVLVIDTRNQYEYNIGTFKNAVSPGTNSFREFPEYVKKKLSPHKDKKIAMFCTGGIRCEKATSYLLGQGFEEVYHLKGGILKYLEDVKPEENLWEGECFVFDGRVAVDEKLEKGLHEMCFACRRPVSPEDKKSSKYEEGISCPSCYDCLTEKKRAGLRERQYQIKLAEERNDQHIGVPTEEKKLSGF